MWYANMNISKLSEPVQGLDLTMLVRELARSLEKSDFETLSAGERDSQKYRATSFETLSMQEVMAGRAEFTIFEVPKRGFYTILSTTQNES